MPPPPCATAALLAPCRHLPTPSASPPRTSPHASSPLASYHRSTAAGPGGASYRGPMAAALAVPPPRRPHLPRHGASFRGPTATCPSNASSLAAPRPRRPPLTDLQQ
ncbi:hypothetical protein PAHAL_9G327900 [Panicum hallii]|uniref:Uncharacterized protein n=1 Tax=Panicum hallii TaxID=206008 RepID=A0A2T8I3A9_9POAL|nr:hypothetical protein PAHAL_9G327900 [Panicum hallii]